jgi:conjugative relaxase-like TrwC/TraI family protein
LTRNQSFGGILQVITHTVIGNTQKAAEYFINGSEEALSLRPVIHISREFEMASGIVAPPDTREALVALLAGFAPGYGAALRSRFSLKGRRGNEFTLSTDKTLGIAAALLPQEMASRVLAAHEEASAEVIRVMRTAFSASISRVAKRVEFSPHAVTYAFTHTLNRKNEPHLHTHIVTPNLLWLPARARFADCNIHFVYKQKAAIDGIYNRLMADALTRRGISAAVNAAGFCFIPELEELKAKHSTPRRMILEAVARIEAAEGRKVPYSETEAIWMKMRPKKTPFPGFRFGELEHLASAVARPSPPPAPPPPVIDDPDNFIVLPHSKVIREIFERLKKNPVAVAASAEAIAAVRDENPVEFLQKKVIPRGKPVAKAPGESNTNRLPRHIRVGVRLIPVNNPKLLRKSPTQIAKIVSKTRKKHASVQKQAALRGRVSLVRPLGRTLGR